MIESLADQWMRAGSELICSPGYLNVYEGVARYVLDEALRSDLQRIAPHSLVGADPMLVRAVRAETEVRLRWGVTVGRHYVAPVTEDPYELEVSHKGAVASWAAEAIVRRRVGVQPLEAEPTLQQLADWLVQFSEALALALARVEMVRVPAHITGGMLDLRAGLGEGATRTSAETVRVLRDPSGRTFSSVDLTHWRLTPPKGHQFALHLGFDGNTGRSKPNAIEARSVLSGGYLRAYMATWALAEEHGGEHGLFEMDVRRVLLDFYGLTPKPTTVRGKRYQRPPPTAERELAEHFEALQETLLEGIGDVRVGPRPESLVSYYNGPKRRRVYRHAPLALIAVSKNFVQTPHAVMRLETRDTPSALGIAHLWRRHAREVLRGPGHYRAPLQQLAASIGEDVSQQTRDRGASAYYRNLAERLVRVMRDGQLGDVHLEGEGPSAIATLTPSLTLATVYQSLAEDRPARTLEAELAETMARSRRPGRPRKRIR